MIERKPFFWELLQGKKDIVLQQLSHKEMLVLKELQKIFDERNSYPKGAYLIKTKRRKA